MPIVLKGFETLLQRAVRHYWRTLEGQGAKQRTGIPDRGGRAAVTGGKQMMGYLRFQAQYLRRIRLPAVADIPPTLASEIRAAFRGRAFGRLDELALDAYSIEDLPDFDFVDTRE